MQSFEHGASPDAPVIHGEIIDQFYAPVQFDGLSMLVSEYDRTKARIIEVHDLITQEKVSGVMGFFFSGNSSDQYGHSALLRHTSSFSEIFQLEGALNDLTATYWARALSHTDLMDHMPQERRTQWHNILNAWRAPKYKRGENPEMDMPEFNLDNLRATLEGLMARRAEFLAERIDGIFRALSRTHVTNSPEAFNKLMIMSGMYTEFGSSDHTREGYVHDLRVVVAKFMGRDEPDRSTTSQILNLARAKRGEWLEIDGGSLRLRGYKVGTCHLEVHPDMAWRLNGILAYLYPAAIPESFRKRPSRPKANGFTSKALYERSISNAVASVLSSMETHFYLVPSTNWRQQYDRVKVRNSLTVRSGSREHSKHLMSEVDSIMSMLGGVLTKCETHKHLTYWQFDYDPLDVVKEVAAVGHVPDHRSHQFYPTPREVGQQLVDWLDIQQHETVSEPSAGQGGIADLLPKDRTLCVEISPLHCQILRQKGHTVIEADFLSWNPGTRFNVIAMNPPFSELRWQKHLSYAGTLVENGGRIGAVLPLSAKSQAADLLPGFELEFSAPINNAFEGTSISVVLLKAVKK